MSLYDLYLTWVLILSAKSHGWEPVAVYAISWLLSGWRGIVRFACYTFAAVVWLGWEMRSMMLMRLCKNAYALQLSLTSMKLMEIAAYIGHSCEGAPFGNQKMRLLCRWASTHFFIGPLSPPLTRLSGSKNIDWNRPLTKPPILSIN